MPYNRQWLRVQDRDCGSNKTGATGHTAPMDVIFERMFSNRVISPNSHSAWPSMSPDLTPFDFCLSKFYLFFFIFLILNNFT